MFGGEFNPLDVLAHAASLKCADVTAPADQAGEQVSNENDETNGEVSDEDGPKKGEVTVKIVASEDVSASVSDDEKHVTVSETVSENQSKSGGSVSERENESTGANDSCNVDRAHQEGVDSKTTQPCAQNPDHSYACEDKLKVVKTSTSSATTATVDVVKCVNMPPDVQETVNPSKTDVSTDHCSDNNTFVKSSEVGSVTLPKQQKILSNVSTLRTLLGHSTLTSSSSSSSSENTSCTVLNACVINNVGRERSAVPKTASQAEKSSIGSRNEITADVTSESNTENRVQTVVDDKTELVKNSDELIKTVSNTESNVSVNDECKNKDIVVNTRILGNGDDVIIPVSPADRSPDTVETGKNISCHVSELNSGVSETSDKVHIDESERVTQKCPVSQNTATNVIPTSSIISSSTSLSAILSSPPSSTSSSSLLLSKSSVLPSEESQRAMSISSSSSSSLRTFTSLKSQLADVNQQSSFQDRSQDTEDYSVTNDCILSVHDKPPNSDSDVSKCQPGDPVNNSLSLQTILPSSVSSKHKYIIEDDIPPIAKFYTSPKKSDSNVTFAGTSTVSSSTVSLPSSSAKLPCNYHVLSVTNISGASSGGGIKKLLIPTSSLTNLSSQKKMKTFLVSSSQLKALNLPTSCMGPPLKLVPHKQSGAVSSGAGIAVTMPSISVPVSTTVVSPDSEHLESLPCDIRSPGADSGVSTASPASVVSDREDPMDDVLVSPLENDHTWRRPFEKPPTFKEFASEISDDMTEVIDHDVDLETEATDGGGSIVTAVSLSASESTKSEKSVDNNKTVTQCDEESKRRTDNSDSQDINVADVSASETVPGKDNTKPSGSATVTTTTSTIASETSSTTLAGSDQLPPEKDCDSMSSLCVSSIMKMVAEEEHRISTKEAEDIDVCRIDQEDDDEQLLKPQFPAVDNKQGENDNDYASENMRQINNKLDTSDDLSGSLTKPLSFSMESALADVSLFNPEESETVKKEPVALDEASRDSLASSMSGRVTPALSDNASVYEISSPGSKNLNIKVTAKVSPESTPANQSKCRATIGSLGSLTAANFKVSSEIPRELSSIAGRQGVKMSTELYARLKSPGPVSPIVTKLSSDEGLTVKKSPSQSLLTSHQSLIEDSSLVGVSLVDNDLSDGKIVPKVCARSGVTSSQDPKIKPKLGRPRTKKCQTKEQASPLINFTFTESQSEVHPLVDHDYCQFTSFCGRVQRSIIAKSESRMERKYTKKTKAARTKGTLKTNLLMTNKKLMFSEDSTSNDVDLEKGSIGSSNNSRAASPAISVQTKKAKHGRKYAKERNSAKVRTDPASKSTKAEAAATTSKRKYERRFSSEKKTKTSAMTSTCLTRQKSDKNYVKITGSYQDEFVYFATKRKSNSKRRQMKENPTTHTGPPVSHQLPPVNVFDWYKEMSRADKSSRFGAETHKMEATGPQNCGLVRQNSQDPDLTQIASDLSSYIPTPVENMMVESVVESHPDLEALGLTPDQVRTVLSAMDAAEMNSFKDLGQSECKEPEAAVNGNNPMETSLDAENLQPSIDMTAYNDILQAKCGSTTPDQFLDISVNGCNQNASGSKLFDLDDLHDLLPSDMVNMNMILNDFSPVKSAGLNGSNNKTNNKVEDAQNTSLSQIEFDQVGNQVKLPTSRPVNVPPNSAAVVPVPAPQGTNVYGDIAPFNLGRTMDFDHKTLDKLELFPEITSAPVSSSSAVSEVTAPELTTVSMYWNDLPGLLINNREFVRLVDIHKQVLPAKDTGILKKRCQMLGLEIANCSELQRDFLIRYANAAKSKSTWVVPKEAAKNLIGFYVDPKPKVSKQVSAEQSEAVIDKKTEEDSESNLDTSGSTEEKSNSPVSSRHTTRRDSTDSQQRRKLIQIKLKDQTVMRVVTEMEVSDDEEEEEEVEEFEALAQIDSEGIPGIVSENQHPRHPHVRRMSKNSETCTVSGDESPMSKQSVISRLEASEGGDIECLDDTDSDYVPSPIKRPPTKKKRELVADSDTMSDDSISDTSFQGYSDFSGAESKENVEDELRLNAKAKQELNRRYSRGGQKKRLTKAEKLKIDKLKSKLKRKELKLKEKLKKFKMKVKENSSSLQKSTRSRAKVKKGETRSACKPDKSKQGTGQPPQNQKTEEEDVVLVTDVTTESRLMKTESAKPNVSANVNHQEKRTVVPVLHRDFSHREGHRGRTQSGDVHLNLYQAKNSPCVQCLTCNEYFSVSKFMKHLHRANCPDEITEVLLPQQLDLRSASSSEKDVEVLWEELKKRRLSFEIDQNHSDKDSSRAKRESSSKDSSSKDATVVQQKAKMTEMKEEKAGKQELGDQKEGASEERKVDVHEKLSEKVDMNEKSSPEKVDINEKTCEKVDPKETHENDVKTITCEKVDVNGITLKKVHINETTSEKVGVNEKTCKVDDREKIVEKFHANEKMHKKVEKTHKKIDVSEKACDSVNENEKTCTKVDINDRTLEGCTTTSEKPSTADEASDVNSGTRHSSRVRKRKQLHPIESYIYAKILPASKEPEVKKQTDGDSPEVSRFEHENGKVQVMDTTVDSTAATPPVSRRRRRSSYDDKKNQSPKVTSKYDLRTTSPPEESPPNKRRRVLTRRNADI